MNTLTEYLAEAEKNHGHMCPGQALGVRMAMLGCRLVGIEEPKAGKRLIVFVEIDRCAADASTRSRGAGWGGGRSSIAISANLRRPSSTPRPTRPCASSRSNLRAIWRKNSSPICRPKRNGNWRHTRHCPKRDSFHGVESG